MTAAVLERPALLVRPAELPRMPRLVPAPDCEPPLTVVRQRQREPEYAIPAQRTAPPVIAEPPAREHRRWAPAVPRPRAHHQLRTRTRPLDIRAEAVPLWSVDSDSGVRRTATAELPDITNWATVFCRGMLETLSGLRRVDQLRTCCAPDVYAGLEARAEAVRESPALLVSLDVGQPADGIAEAAAVFRCAGRTRALAMRVQGLDGRWRVTELQLG